MIPKEMKHNLHYGEVRGDVELSPYNMGNDDRLLSKQIKMDLCNEPVSRSKSMVKKKKSENPSNNVGPFIPLFSLYITGLHITSLRKHAYSNILKISPPKTESFQIKNSDIFIFLLKT